MQQVDTRLYVDKDLGPFCCRRDDIARAAVAAVSASQEDTIPCFVAADCNFHFPQFNHERTA